MTMLSQSTIYAIALLLVQHFLVGMLFGMLIFFLIYENMVQNGSNAYVPRMRGLKSLYPEKNIVIDDKTVFKVLLVIYILTQELDLNDKWLILLRWF